MERLRQRLAAAARSVAEGLEACAGGGKLLRGGLLLRLAEARGVGEKKALAAACAVELVHAASLLHDDVVDGAALRRHVPALWMRWGVKAAILCGDGLLAAAMEELRTAGVEPEERDALTAATARVVRAELAWELGGGGGDVLAHAREKTGPLFGFAAAAWSGEGARREAWWESGERLGLAYQMADDLADVAGAGGKSGGRDAARGLRTCAAVVHWDEVEREVRDALSLAEKWATSEERSSLANWCGEILRPALDAMLAGNPAE